MYKIFYKVLYYWNRCYLTKNIYTFVSPHIA